MLNRKLLFVTLFVLAAGHAAQAAATDAVSTSIEALDVSRPTSAVADPPMALPQTPWAGLDAHVQCIIRGTGAVALV